MATASGQVNISQMTRHLGRVAALFRYPVKSMASERLDHVEVSWNGFDGDRRWAFIRGGLKRSGFPWLTIRENPSMWKYEPSFADPSDPNRSMTFVRTPQGEELEITEPDLAKELGFDCTLIKQDRGVFDAMPLSLISLQTIKALGSSVGRDLDPRRFRPNIVIDATDGGDGPEDSWVGDTITIGGIQMRIDKRDKRCVVINVDPDTTVKDPVVLRAVAQERSSFLGVYGTVARCGRVALGDPVFID
jgi:uncharacterized protein YcbX